MFEQREIQGVMQVFAVDGLYNETQLSRHPTDAPTAFYDQTQKKLRRGVRMILRTNHRLAGYVAWTAPGQATQYESFATYNQRLGLQPGDPAYLVKLNYDAEQLRLQQQTRLRDPQDPEAYIETYTPKQKPAQVAQLEEPLDA